MAKSTIHPLRRFLTSRIFFAVIIIIGGLLILVNVRVYRNSSKIEKEISEMERDIGSLQQKKLESLEILKYVTSKNFVEDTARTELNLKKPGERELIVKNPDMASATLANSISLGESGQALPNPVKWWYYFTRHALPQ